EYLDRDRTDRDRRQHQPHLCLQADPAAPLRRGAYPRGGRTRRLAGRPLTGRSPAPGGAQDRHSPFPRFMLWSTSRMPGSDSDSNYRSALVVVPHWLMALVVPTVPVVTAPTASV